MSDNPINPIVKSKKEESLKKRWAANSQLMFAILASAVTIFAALLGGILQERSSHHDFLRTERSKVYAEFLEAAVRYQNALYSYTWILSDLKSGEDSEAIREKAEPLFESALSARENFVNKNAKVQMLQCKAFAETQGLLADNLRNSHDHLGSVIESKINGEKGGLTYQQIQEEFNNFNDKAEGLRRTYLDTITENFQKYEGEECPPASNAFSLVSVLPSSEHHGIHHGSTVRAG